MRGVNNICISLMDRLNKEVPLSNRTDCEHVTVLPNTVVIFISCSTS